MNGHAASFADWAVCRKAKTVAHETRRWEDTALDCDRLTREEADRPNEGLMQAGRMLNRVMERSASFRGKVPSVVGEDSVECFAP